MNHTIRTLVLYFLFSIINATLLAIPSYAHQTSTAYFSGQLNDSGNFAGQVQIRLFDLERSIGLDSDNNGELTWSETLLRQNAVEAFLRKSLELKRNNEQCPMSFNNSWQLDDHFNEPYLVLSIRSQCALQGPINIGYQGLFSIDSDHKLLVNINDNDQSFSRVIDTDNRNITLDTKNGSILATFKEFFKQGAIHIWIGTDHILFLLCLLFACIFSVKNRAQTSWKSTLWQLLGIVTAFTIAHSVTLTATALNWVTVSSRWVEVGIAVTVLAAALNNIFQVVKRIAWLTFGFGLLHGMGFAGVLGELGLPGDQTFLSVLAFNVGVEFGQVVIIAIALPILFLTRLTNIKPHYWLNTGSTIIALVSIFWIVERLL